MQRAVQLPRGRDRGELAVRMARVWVLVVSLSSAPRFLSVKVVAVDTGIPDLFGVVSARGVTPGEGSWWLL